MIPYSRQTITKKDIISVKKTLMSEYITQGDKVTKFEKNIKKICKSKYAITTNSASTSLFIACKALEVTKGDYVWTSPITFAATANAPILCGAKIDFVDIDFNTQNISTTILEEKLKIAKNNKKLPKLLIVVHMSGHPCDMKKIYSLSKIYKFKILEDASHALGSKYYKSVIGDCAYSHACVFSFHPVKIITTGEGGVVTTNLKQVYNKMLLFRNNGIIKNIKDKKKWKYQQFSSGLNFRLSDIHASLGLSQLSNLKKFLSKRNYFAKRYKNKLKSLDITFQDLKKESYSSYHLFIIKVNSKIKNELINYMRNKKIMVNYHYIPLYKQSFFRNNNFAKAVNSFKNSNKYYSSGISIPLFPSMTIKEQDIVIKYIKRFFNEKSK